MEEFRFEEAEHAYYLGSVRIPSVTQILDAVGLISAFAKEEHAAERGKLIHLACKYLAQGVLDWSTVDAAILGYVLSYKKFLTQMNWAARAVEVSLYDKDFLFAGTFDVDFKEGWLFDLKSGSKAKWHALQTAAYQHLNGGKGKRGTLYLQADGSIPKLEQHGDRTDWPKFLACRTVYELLEANNGNRTRS